MLAGVAAYIKALRPEVKVIGVEADDAAGKKTLFFLILERLYRSFVVGVQTLFCCWCSLQSFAD